uniref:Uncharacterized protein n=1 Tax=Chrysotila carterae TaxID=13221 RepID=A0A7S4BPQ7_CHRCT
MSLPDAPKFSVQIGDDSEAPSALPPILQQLALVFCADERACEVMAATRKVGASGGVKFSDLAAVILRWTTDHVLRIDSARLNTLLSTSGSGGGSGSVSVRMAKRVASAESDALLKLARWLHRVASQRTGTETKPVSAAAAAAAAATLAAAEAAHRDALTALQQICVFGQPAKVGEKDSDSTDSVGKNLLNLSMQEAPISATEVAAADRVVDASVHRDRAEDSSSKIIEQ